MNNNETVNNIISALDKFNNLLNKFGDNKNFSAALKAALAENRLSSPENIREDYNKNADNERLLRIGIVGAVKSGKSSLLNSVFFNGENILPVSATPMTAALTEIQYSEKCSFTAEFFTNDDIESLKELHDEYIKLLEEYKNDELMKTIKAKEEREGGNKESKPELKSFFSSIKDSIKDTGKKLISYFKSEEEKKEAETRAMNAAKGKLNKNYTLSGAYEQYEKIKNSNSRPGKERETYYFNNKFDMSGKLRQFVGADGKYMPFTSRVLITLPEEELKNICIVDTPGFNDPVPSRDMKARKALSECDVVLILSPCGQFLNESTLQVISRITTKEGIRELYLIPSQADNELYMEIRDESRGDIREAINILKNKMIDAAKDRLKAINKDNVFDALIKETEKRLFLTSGICSSMAQTFDSRNKWDSGKINVWENLKESYPDYFESSSDTGKAYLKQLGNIEIIKNTIDSVKKRKYEIFSQKLSNFSNKYKKAFEDVKDTIIKFINNKLSEIEELDIKGKEEEIKFMKKSFDALSIKFVSDFEGIVSNWCKETKDEIYKFISDQKAGCNGAIENATYEYTETWNGGFLWLTEYSKNVICFEADIILENLEIYKNNLIGRVPDYIDNCHINLKKSIIDSVLRSVHNISSENQSEFSCRLSSNDLRINTFNVIASTQSTFDRYSIRNEYENRLNEIIESMPAAPYFPQLPDSSDKKINAIYRWNTKARAFIKSAHQRCTNMEYYISKDIGSRLDNTLNEFRSREFTKKILSDYISQLNQSLEELKEPKQALEKYKLIEKEVNLICL